MAVSRNQRSSSSIASAVRMPRPVRSGVDADAVGTLVGTVADGMPMDHHEPVIAVVEQERLADPAQVGLPLLVKRDARANSGMDEEVIAEAASIGETTEKLDVAGRDRRPDGGQCGLVGGCGDRLRIGPVAFEALRAAEPSQPGISAVSPPTSRSSTSS